MTNMPVCSPQWGSYFHLKLRVIEKNKYLSQILNCVSLTSSLNKRCREYQSIGGAQTAYRSGNIVLAELKLLIMNIASLYIVLIQFIFLAWNKNLASNWIEQKRVSPCTVYGIVGQFYDILSIPLPCMPTYPFNISYNMSCLSCINTDFRNTISKVQPVIVAGERGGAGLIGHHARSTTFMSPA